MRGKEPILDRFMRYVEMTPICWQWIGTIHKAGRGHFKISTNVVRYAHRVAYELFVGPIPNGMQIHHKCYNPLCVNPRHLELIERLEHIKLHHSMTHCPSGHEYSLENTYVHVGPRKRKRYCMECHRIRERDRYRAKICKSVSV